MSVATKICPVCGRRYRPMFERVEDAPEGTIWKEQHITGICSDGCWDKIALNPDFETALWLAKMRAKKAVVVVTRERGGKRDGRVV